MRKMEADKAELRSCPFCDGADKHEDNCYITLLATFYKERGYYSVSETDLSNAWNTRAERTCEGCSHAGVDLDICDCCSVNYESNYSAKEVE